MATIRQMGGVVHPSSAQKRVTVMLRAYCDESGTHWGGPNACDVFVLCGYIAPEEVWEMDFAPKWHEMLNGRAYFHATEVEHDPQGGELKMAAVSVAIGCGIIGIGGGLLIPAYRRMMAPYVRAKKMHKDPYLFLFSQVLIEAIHMSATFVGEDPNETIAFVFDQHPRWSVMAHQMFVAMQNDEEWPNRVRLGTVAFEDKKKFAPLQAADHIAFETYHYMNDGPGTHRPAMERFKSWPQNHGKYYNEEGLQAFIDVCKGDGKF